LWAQLDEKTLSSKNKIEEWIWKKGASSIDDMSETSQKPIREKTQGRIFTQ
jgi:hypothetical protein